MVGVKGTVETVNGKDTLTRVGTTCALCHSTVDNSFAPGIGKRLDGWPNRDLNPGAIIALSPAIDAAKKAVYNSWGKGKYDPRFNVDGINGPVVIPPAYGLNGHQQHHLHRRRQRRRVLEPLCRSGADGRPGIVLGSASAAERHERHSGPGQQQAARAAGLPAQLERTAAAGRQLRCRRGSARQGLFSKAPANCVSCHSGESFTDANSRLHLIAESVADAERSALRIAQRDQAIPDQRR